MLSPASAFQRHDIPIHIKECLPLFAGRYPNYGGERGVEVDDIELDAGRPLLDAHRNRSHTHFRGVARVITESQFLGGSCCESNSVATAKFFAYVVFVSP